MSRFYVPKDAIRNGIINVSGKEAHHIIDVMRLKAADKVVTFDGTGMEYVGIIRELKQKSLSIEIIKTQESSAVKTYQMTLIQAVPKKEKMELIIEKSTELGVDRIVPVFSERTIPVWDDVKKGRHVERWSILAKEASKQCGRSDIPVIEEIRTIGEAIKGARGNGLAVMATLSDDTVALKDILKGFKGGSITVAIGPEGDFTIDEIKDAARAGFKMASLGLRVLRSETAAIAVLSILDYEFSNRM